NEMIAGDAKIDGAKIGNATITNAKIANVNADKIKSGILDTEKAIVRVKRGKQAIKMDDTGFVTVDSNGTERIHIGIRNLGGKGQSDPSTIRFFSGNGSKSAGVGMNVNDTFVVGTEASGVYTEYRAKEYATHYAKQHRFVVNNRPNYWVMQSWIVGGDYNVMLRPSKSGRGYIGKKDFRMWRMYSNYLHLVYDIEWLSTRKNKKNIENVPLEQFSDWFNEISIKTFDKVSHDCPDCVEEQPKTELGIIAE